METTWGPSEGYGDDVRMTEMMETMWGRREDDGDDMGMTGMTCGDHGDHRPWRPHGDLLRAMGTM